MFFDIFRTLLKVENFLLGFWESFIQEAFQVENMHSETGKFEPLGLYGLHTHDHE